MIIGSILIALTTRTWATSLSIALMITICYSNQVARQYYWIYHIFGWIMPICTTLIIYFFSSDQSKEILVLGAEKFGKIQIILSIVLLGLCILINTINLLRMARRTYRLQHDNHVNSETTEGRPLINDDEEEIEEIQSTLGNFCDFGLFKIVIEILEIRPLEADTQLFRHGILVALLTIDAVIVSVFF
jgi:hypothetical protein